MAEGWGIYNFLSLGIDDPTYNFSLKWI